MPPWAVRFGKSVEKEDRLALAAQPHVQADACAKRDPLVAKAAHPISEGATALIASACTRSSSKGARARFTARCRATRFSPSKAGETISTVDRKSVVKGKGCT